VLTAINIRTTVFWDVTPYSLEYYFKRFQNSALREDIFKSSTLATRLQLVHSVTQCTDFQNMPRFDGKRVNVISFSP